MNPLLFTVYTDLPEFADSTGLTIRSPSTTYQDRQDPETQVPPHNQDQNHKDRTRRRTVDDTMGPPYSFHFLEAYTDGSGERLPRNFNIHIPGRPCPSPGWCDAPLYLYRSLRARSRFPRFVVTFKRFFSGGEECNSAGIPVHDKYEEARWKLGDIRNTWGSTKRTHEKKKRSPDGRG
ncbi:hypothetical protein GEV33_002711 [Tenebrio molitor]|uniref:Uncharacterized protein n=1 Tax=Tenebrio molitor TaxID=7067 RepID=A0A8J6HST0_TENMO|nr:hypothetical protein GEV33_002711 [Tenebrio molitor]